MQRFAKIERTIKSFLVEVLGIGGSTENRLISPKGIYSKPKKETAIVLNLANGTNQDVVLCLQKDIELEDNDVILTDDRNYIHFKYKNGIIEIQGDTVFNDGVTMLKDLRVKGKIICDTDIEVGQNITAQGVCGAGSFAGATGGAVVSDSNFETTADVKAGNVSLKTHPHSQGVDSAGDTQQNVSAPLGS